MGGRNKRQLPTTITPQGSTVKKKRTESDGPPDGKELNGKFTGSVNSRKSLSRKFNNQSFKAFESIFTSAALLIVVFILSD